MDNKKYYEIVAGIHRIDLFSKMEYWSYGFCDDPKKIACFIDQFSRSMAFQFRGMTEANPEFKQVIPYCVIRRGSEVFVYERLPKVGEDRLIGKRSVGVGGHMNPIPDVCPTIMIKQNLLRELEEELEFTPAILNMAPIKLVGMINDDTTEVGSVHFGLVYVLDLPLIGAVRVRETEELSGCFIQLKDAIWLDGFESWSRIYLDHAAVK